MIEERRKRDKLWLTKVMYYMASFLMPSILLFNLYNRNHALSHIIYSHVLIIAGLLAVFGLLLFVVFKLIIGSMEGALILVSLSWVPFWLYEPMLEFVRGLFPVIFVPSRVFALLLLAIIGFIITIFRRKRPPFEKVRPAFNIFAFCLIAMFLVNAVPSMSHHIAFASTRARIAQLEYDERPFHIKREFYIDPTLPHPDIYWFHMDGLMSIGTVERFWGLNYEGFREELHHRDFIIYENAQLNGGFSEAAMPALLSPKFYDSFWGEQLASAETMLFDERVPYLFEEVLPSVGLEGQDDVAPYFELFSAFFAGGYEMRIDTYFDYLPTSFKHLMEEQRYKPGIWSSFTRSYLPRLLSMTTPLPMIHHEPTEYDRLKIKHLDNIQPVATFTWFEFMDAHMMFMAHRVMEPSEIPPHMRYDLYPELGFEFSFWRMLDKIDEIIKKNPNAVIIIQSDHGFHYGETQRHLLYQGYTHEQVLELAHSVFSAVRIPDEYGGLEEPIAPLNIARVLVNRFVGENYTLLLSD